MKSAAKVTGEWERRAQEGTTDQGGGAMVVLVVPEYT